MSDEYEQSKKSFVEKYVRSGTSISEDDSYEYLTTSDMEFASQHNPEIQLGKRARKKPDYYVAAHLRARDETY